MAIQTFLDCSQSAHAGNFFYAIFGHAKEFAGAKFQHFFEIPQLKVNF